MPDVPEPEAHQADATPSAEDAPQTVYSADEVKPPVPEANSFGGGIDAADLPPTLPDDDAGPGSAHDAEGWRAIATRP